MFGVLEDTMCGGGGRRLLLSLIIRISFCNDLIFSHNRICSGRSLGNSPNVSMFKDCSQQREKVQYHVIQ